VASFDFGELWAPSGVGFDSGFYTVSLSGLATEGLSSLKLNINVSAVPEASSWVLMGLGLAGVAAVGRRRRQG
jgi:PEP-CTERM motif